MQLILTEGGEPSARQRVQLNELLGVRSVPVAVVSGSVRVRVTAAALGLFNRQLRAFPSDALEDALTYLDIPTRRRHVVESMVRELRAELGPCEAP